MSNPIDLSSILKSRKPREKSTKFQKFSRAQKLNLTTGCATTSRCKLK